VVLECLVESMRLGEGNFTSVVAVRDESVYARTDPPVVSEVTFTLQVVVTPRSALIVFPSLDTEILSVVAGSTPYYSPLTFANFGKTNAGGVDTCATNNTLSFTVAKATTEQSADEWVQLVPEDGMTTLKYVGMETKVRLEFTRPLTVRKASRTHPDLYLPLGLCTMRLPG
jgi:hypothetical protein